MAISRTEAAAKRRADRAYNRALAEYDAPKRASGFEWLVNVVSLVILAAVATLVLGPRLIALVPAAPAPQAPPAPAAESGAQAPALPAESGSSAPAAPVSVEAPAPVVALPTAAVVIAAPAEVVTVPDAAPLRYAPGSGPAPTAAPAPTVATTAFMQIGKDYEANADGTCVRTRRDGALVEFCQQRPMNIGEMSSVADYLRTGMIAGEVVK